MGTFEIYDTQMQNNAKIKHFQKQERKNCFYQNYYKSEDFKLCFSKI